LRLSADQGNPGGQYFYGRCLEHGDGIKQDLINAVRYYELASVAIPWARVAYGCCLEDGKGIAVDLTLAAE
jgi:hypothetical protein